MASTLIILKNTDRLQVGNDGASRIRKHTLLKRLASFFLALAAGAKRGTSIAFTSSATDPVAASGTVTCAAVAAADTVTINGTALTATQHNATGTVTCASVSAADTVTVNGVVFTAVNGGTPTANQFDMSGSDTADAASLVSAINAHTSLSGVVTAANSAGVVTIRAVTAGTSGNSITLASSNGVRLAVSAANLANGAAIGNNQFDYTGTNTQTGAALAAAIAASTTALVSGAVTASNAAGVVTLTAMQKGVAGNMCTLASSNGTRLAVSGARLTGGTGCDGSPTNITI